MILNDAVHDDKQTLTDRAWPPMGWYADWVSGLYVFDIVFDESPIEIRWLGYRKVACGVFNMELKNGTNYLQQGN